MPQLRPQPRAGPGAALPLLLALLAAAVLPQAAAVKSLSAWNTGLITHYGGKQDGAPGSGQRPSDCRAAAAAAACRCRPPAFKRLARLLALYAGMDPNSPSFGTSRGSCGYGAIPKDQ